MAKGLVSLTAVVDVGGRRGLAHKVAITLEACHAVEILQEALARFGSPEIVNTNQGCQFTDHDFVDVVKNQGRQLSIDGNGAWRDTVFVEQLWRTDKYERIYLKDYDNAREDIAACLKCQLQPGTATHGLGRDDTETTFSHNHVTLLLAPTKNGEITLS